jgi:hypothetical protein
MVIDGVDVYPGSPCPHSTGEGCDNYANRPRDPCDNFNCGWIVPDSPLPDWMKPNEGRVIVILNKLAWNGVPVDLAVPVGRSIPPRSLQWLQQFSEKQRRPLIYTEQIVEANKFQKQQQLFAHGPPEFQQEIMRCQQAGIKLW